MKINSQIGSCKKCGYLSLHILLTNNQKNRIMGTSNFFYKNRCVAISDEDYNTGNVPECESDFFGRNKMLLQRVLMLISLSI